MNIENPQLQLIGTVKKNGDAKRDVRHLSLSRWERKWRQEERRGPAVVSQLHWGSACHINVLFVYLVSCLNITNE